ncbi:MAG: hypothetical protein ABIP12_00205, partial [Terriglobales bacterium]
MTTGEILVITAGYLAAFVAVAYFTRAKVRRIVSALVAGAVFGGVVLLAIALGETQGWWRVAKSASAYFPLVLWLGFMISSLPTHLILWRVVRHFGIR